MSNNLNKRISNKSKNIINNKGKNVKNLTINEKLQPYTKGFLDLIKGKKQTNNNSNIVNKTINTKPESSPFDNPLILGLLFVITLSFIIYGLYKYFIEVNSIQIGKTFYGNSLLDYEPLFKINTNEINNCINRCKLDTLCNGITFDDELQQCVGTKEGRIRPDTINFKAWVKGDKEDVSIRTGKLAGYINSKHVIKKEDIPRPRLPSEFNYSFYIYIEDFYNNQGSWKHIFHKGDEIEINNTIDTPNWNDITSNYPNQSIGVWIAPFNNNIRISITTAINKNDNLNSDYKHAYQQKIIHNEEKNVNNVYISDVSYGRFKYPNINNFTSNNVNTNMSSFEKQVEYIDIYRLPIKKIIHISVNFTGMTMEVYINGKLYKIKNLLGYPEFNDGNLFCMFNKTISGSIIDFKFTPERLTHNKISEFLNNLKNLEYKTLQQIKKISNN